MYPVSLHFLIHMCVRACVHALADVCICIGVIKVNMYVVKIKDEQKKTNTSLVRTIYQYNHKLFDAL